MVYANRRTKRYHATRRRDACRQKFILPTNLIRFKTTEEAEAEGYRPCRRCKGL